MIAAIIPAAGGSTRMGAPKALLKFRGATFLQAILDACAAVGLQPIVAVLGEDRDKILTKHDLSHVTVVESADWGAGTIGSVQAGITALLNHPVEAALVWHVDRPHVSLETIQALVDRARVSRAGVVLPTFSARRGHPAIFGRQLFGQLLEVPRGEGARWVVRGNPEQVEEVAVSDRAVLEDIGTPEAYQALLRRVDATRE